MRIGNGPAAVIPISPMVTGENFSVNQPLLRPTGAGRGLERRKSQKTCLDNTGCSAAHRGGVQPPKGPRNWVQPLQADQRLKGFFCLLIPAGGSIAKKGRVRQERFPDDVSRTGAILPLFLPDFFFPLQRFLSPGVLSGPMDGSIGFVPASFQLPSICAGCPVSARTGDQRMDPPTPGAAFRNINDRSIQTSLSTNVR